MTASPIAPRQLLLSASLVLALLSGASSQQQPAPVVGKTLDNAAVGLPSLWDFAGTDMTFKTATEEVWLVDPYSGSPVINIFKATDLLAQRRQLIVNLPASLVGAPILGIAEIPHGALKDNLIILVDPMFGTLETPAPQLGIFDATGNLVPGEVFIPITGLDPSVQLTAIDVNPVREEFVAYDAANHAFFVLDFTFSVVAGPIQLLGSSTFFTGAWGLGDALRGGGTGIAYSSADTVLAISGIRNILDAHWVLEYDLARDGAYSGRAIDFGAAREQTEPGPWTLFISIDTATIGAESFVFAHNLANESVYAFGLQLEPHGPPVSLQSCAYTAEDQYVVTWSLLPGTSTTNIFIFENGVQVATLASAEVSYTSPLPVLGKAFVEVATEGGGIASGVRSTCEFQNTGVPALGPDTQFRAQIGDVLGRPVTGVAVTKTPATTADFRAYVIGAVTNDVLVFGAQLNLIETLPLNPRVVGAGRGPTYNFPSIGVSLFRFEPGGIDHLAVLDPDGPNNTTNPSAHFYPLSGPQRGQLFRSIDPIELSGLGEPPPELRDWDWDGADGFVASGFLPSTGEDVIVRIRLLGTRLVGTQMAPIPHRGMTPFTRRPTVGTGVSVLPSGNLLVAGSDTFSDTYTEALLMTPFTDDPPAPPQLVGYAQGLLVTNQFFSDVGIGAGPLDIYGLDTAFVPLPPDPPPPAGVEGVGVTYLPTSDLVLIFNPAIGGYLYLPLNLLVQSTNEVSHPDLAAEQLNDRTEDVPAGQKIFTGDISPTFASRAEKTDYYYYLFNPSTTNTVRLELAVRLDGVAIPAAAETISMPPGRYFRRTLLGRAEEAIAVEATNTGAGTVRVRLLVGASGIAPGGVDPTSPVFRRGDCDRSGAVNITDAVAGLNALFRGGLQPTCLDACDADDNGLFNITDMVALLNRLFRGADPLPAPGADTCGEDPTGEDALAPCDYGAEICQ